MAMNLASAINLIAPHASLIAHDLTGVLIAQTADTQSAGEIIANAFAQSTIPISPAAWSNITAEFNELQVKLHTYGAEFQRLRTELDTTVPGLTRDTITQLQLAMGKVYIFAVFIRGDYDAREEDPARRTELGVQMIDAFEVLRSKAEAALKAVSKIHEKNVELQSSKLGPLNTKVEMKIKETEIELERVTNQIHGYQEQIRTQQGALETTCQALRAQEAKLRDAEQLHLQTSVITGVLFGLLTSSPMPQLDIFHLQEDLNTLRNNVTSTRTEILRMEQALARVRQDYTSHQHSSAILKDLQIQLPGLDFQVGHLLDTSDMFQKRLTEVLDVCTDALRKVREVHGTVDPTVRLSITKKDYAIGLLAICEAALQLFHENVNDQVQLVIDEIVVEYGAKGILPAMVQDMADAVRAKLILALKKD